jgi:thioredoxin-related protein
VTYPDVCVAAALNDFFVPVQVNVDQAKDLVKKFRVLWTPNINVLDPEGNLLYHVEGWQVLQRYHPQSSWGIRSSIV